MFRYVCSRLMATGRSSRLCYCRGISIRNRALTTKMALLTKNDAFNRPFAVPRLFSTTNLTRTQSSIPNEVSTLSENDFVVIAKATLDHISEQLDALAEDPQYNIPEDYDVSFTGDVLTLRLGGNRGTYVLNTQTPNKQIWLSSPFSGPKRYDWDCGDDRSKGLWIYRHDGGELGALISKELTDTYKSPITINPYVHLSK